MVEAVDEREFESLEWMKRQRVPDLGVNGRRVPTVRSQSRHSRTIAAGVICFDGGK